MVLWRYGVVVSG